MKKSKVFALAFLIFASSSILSVHAGSNSVYFANGGQAALNASSTSVRGTAFHGYHTNWSCQSTVIATYRNGSTVQIGPVSGIGTATAYRNNMKNVAGAQGTFLINGERRTAVVTA